ncbi:MAG TPA: hypothetical protein VMT69_00375 [Kineosporiaceae bacterium]|nr:hypothetical protein [Kineosporiaceae bacterium]
MVLPSLACALVYGGAVALMAASAVHALEPPAVAGQPATILDLLPPPAAVVVRTRPTPVVTEAPTAREWVVQLPAGSR